MSELQDAKDQDHKDAKRWAKTWDALTSERLAAARKGSSSPWTGVKQWLVEVPMNAHQRGFDPNAQESIDQREVQLQQAIQSLKANPNQLRPNVWSGIR